MIGRPLDEVAIPVGVNPEDALLQLGMGGKHHPQAVFHLAKEQVGQLLGPRGVDQGARRVTAYDFEGVTDPVGIAGELNRRCVREVFLLFGNGRLDQPCHQAAQQADQIQAQTDNQQTAGVVFTPTGTAAPAPSAVQHDRADIANKCDAPQHGGQPDTQSHVTIEDVAEFMPYDALQLVPGQLHHRATGNGNHRITG